MKLATALLASLAAALPAQAAVLLYDSFSGPTGALPSGWTDVGTVAGNDLVSAGNLSVPGLQESVGNKWALDNSLNNTYRNVFSGTPLAGGATVFFSFILQVDNITGLSTAGHSSGLFYLNSSTAIGPANGVAAIGIRKDATDATKFNLTVDGDFRGPSNVNSVKLPDQFTPGTAIFIVGSYTLSTGAANTSVANFWINPPSSAFGSLAAPSVTATDLGGNRTGIQSFIVTSATGASGSPDSWSIDELRIGTTWADVTPASVPEPSAAAFLGGLGALACATLRRRRR